MKVFAWLLALSAWAVVGAQRHDEEAPIATSAELRAWCKAETEAYYVARGITPYNWSASGWEEGGTLFVRGGWLIGRDRVGVECRVAKGAKRKYAVYEIPNE